MKETHYCDYISLYGDSPTSEDMAKTYRASGHEPPDLSRFGLDFSPVNQYSYLPFIIKNDITIHLQEDKNKIKSIPCKLSINLLEMLHAIYYEISFYGSPTQRDETIGKIEEEAKKIKRREENIN